MSGRIIGRAVAVLVLLILALFTYPGADVASLAVWLTPPAIGGSPRASAGGLAWLHIEHPAGRTAYIADPQGRLVLLHGAIPGGMIDFWSGAGSSNLTPKPFYPIDPSAYEGRCPDNSSLIRVPPLCRSDIAQMAAFGFNSLRLPISWSLLEPARGQFSQTYLARIAQVVDWARAEGLYVIFDMHQDAYSRYVGRASPPPIPGGDTTDLQYDNGAPDWATITDGFPSEVFGGQRELNPAVLEADSNFWYNRAGVQDEYIATVAVLARKFMNDSTVAGYSIFNEPWPGWNLPPGWEDLLLFPFYRRVIDAVTGVHDGLPCPTHIYMPAPCGYPDLGVRDRNQLFFLDLGLPRELTDLPTHLDLAVSSYPNLVAGLHAYTHGYTPDSIFLHQDPDKASYPWGGYEQTYASAERESRAINAALMVTEFGNDPKWDPLILANELIEQEQHRVGFAFWTWKENCGGAHSWGMFEGIECSKSKQLQAQPPSGCLRPGRERLLARVYPSASADPNLTFHYDPSTGAFELRASGQFGDVPTVVVIPVEVTGSVTVSGAVAGEPAISQQPHGVRIVTVYPSGGAFSISVAAASLAPLGCDTSAPS